MNYVNKSIFIKQEKMPLDLQYIILGNIFSALKTLRGHIGTIKISQIDRYFIIANKTSIDTLDMCQYCNEHDIFYRYIF